MRILGVSELWLKLAKPKWTTFRFERKDRDWAVGEIVQVVYKPRSRKDTTRGILGIAEIVKIEPRWVHLPVESWQLDVIHRAALDDVSFVSEREAKLDGFVERAQMVAWMQASYGSRTLTEPMNRLSLRWTQVWLHSEEQAPDTRRKWAELNGAGNPIEGPTIKEVLIHEPLEVSNGEYS